MVSVRIRRGEPDDAAMLAALGRRTFIDQFAADNDPADVAEYVGRTYDAAVQARQLVDPALTYLVAEVESVPAGYALLRAGEAPASVPSRSPLELMRFYVASEWQGRGVARPMMEACVAEARRRAADVLWLAVWEHNPRAIAFYARCGFTDVGSQPFVLGRDVQTDRVMVRTVGGD